MAQESAYLKKYKALTESFLANKGLQYLTESAASVFGKPVAVFDPSFFVLADAANSSISGRTDAGHADVSRQLAISGQATISGYADASGHSGSKSAGAGIISGDIEIEALKRENVLDAVSKSTDIFFFRCGSAELPDGDQPNAAVSRENQPNAAATGIYIKNTFIAFVVILFTNAEFTGEEQELFITFKSLLEQELLKDRAYQRGRGEYMSYLLLDLLTNKYPDEKTMEKRLATVDFTPAGHMSVVVIRKRIEAAAGCSMELVSIQLRPLLRNHMHAVLEDSIVLLLNFPEGTGPDKELLDGISRVCANNDLIAGISNDFSSIKDLTKHYRLATRTALVCQRYIEDHRIIFYDDVFDLALLEYCDRHNNLMDYVHSSILALMDYDSKYGTDYLYTFWIFTECGCNTQAAAAKLFIHKNTLAYRVGKIKEITGSDLTGGKDMFAFQLSMRILRMLGKLAK